ncbi:hypothetical protein BAJUN_01350 [Bajunvirus bajun]|uniref:Uncharacterized protein n=1 Tax=Brevundimonas phage vB_BgoS-Bajun TaxID=2948594 RepID=A0A9E7SU42_9CAUD|nr:hypothetical protein BAJUN_01350 [Brevundimonas phage vB_BgoS-Bajun]
MANRDPEVWYKNCFYGPADRGKKMSLSGALEPDRSDSDDDIDALRSDVDRLRSMMGSLLAALVSEKVVTISFAKEIAGIYADITPDDPEIKWKDEDA